MSDSKIPEGFACTGIHRNTEDSHASVEANGDGVRWTVKHIPTKRWRSGLAADVQAGVTEADSALAWMRANPPAADGEWTQEFEGGDWEAEIHGRCCVVQASRDGDGWEWEVCYGTSGTEPTRELAMARAKAVATAIVAPLASVPE